MFSPMRNEMEKVSQLTSRIAELEAERDEALNQLSSMTHAVQTLERHGEKVKAEREKLKAEVEAWRDRFQYCGFDGTSIVMSG